MAEFDNYAGQYSDLLHDPMREKFAPGSGFFFDRKWELLADYLQRVGLQPETSQWLDVGCGTGDLLRRGAARFRHAAGCDVSTEMLAQCKGLNVVPQTDPGRLPFADGQFQLVTAVCVYHHVPLDGRAALTNEIVRVLSPGGAACIIEHNPFNPLTQMIVRRTPIDADAQLLTSGTATHLLENAGLKKLSTQFFLYLPEQLYRKAPVVERLLARMPAGGQYATFGHKIS